MAQRLASPAAHADLASEIADLKAQFQHVADVHPWICLAVPPVGGKFGWLTLGAAFGHVAPEWGHLGVRTPEQRLLRTILDHVYVLTDKAGRLLFRVLERPHQIPADIEDEIWAFEERSIGYGRVRWLWFAVPLQDINRYENYPQVAATALFQLREYYGQDGLFLRSKKRKGAGKRGRPPISDHQDDKRFYDDWLASGLRTIKDFAKARGMPYGGVRKRLERYQARVRRAKSADKLT
jgi:hypothetical protein